MSQSAIAVCSSAVLCVHITVEMFLRRYKQMPAHQAQVEGSRGAASHIIDV